MFFLLDSKTVDRTAPVAYRHTPLLRYLGDGQVDHFLGRIGSWEEFSFSNCFTDHAVQRLDGVGGVDRFADVRWITCSRITEQRVEVGPLCAPRLARLWVLLTPARLERAQCQQRLLFGGRFINLFKISSHRFVIFSFHALHRIADHVHDAQ